MSTDKERIVKLEADAQVSDAHTGRLHDEAVVREEHILELDGRAVARDEQIVGLVKEVEGLQKAKKNASLIEQAKGVIMSTMHCGPDAAFAALVARSQRENRKLVEIAAEIAGAQSS